MVLAGSLALIGCAAAVSLPASREPVPADAASSPPPVDPGTSALESSIHQLVNKHRASRDHPALRFDPRVAALAREHSEAMASGQRSFSHEGFDGRASAIRAFLPARALAENVAYDSRSGGQLTARVVEGWIASGGHRRNIEGDFTITGVGAARGDRGIYYFTQIFVRTH